MSCSINIVQTLLGFLTETLSEQRNWAGKKERDAAQAFPCNAKASSGHTYVSAAKCSR